MPPLERLLVDYDLGLLRIIAELWGVELGAPTQREAVTQLTALLLEPERVSVMVDSLPAEAKTALEAVRHAGGRLPLANFSRTHGEVRAMGTARRDRERPWANAPSPAEVLWYRALTGHAFFESERGPQEFVFIPEDVLKLLPEANTPPPPPPPGHPVEAYEVFTPAETLVADDVTTLLAFAQSVPLKLESGTTTTKVPGTVRRFLREPLALDLCFQLALHLELLHETPLKPNPAAARAFLEQSHWAQTRALAEAWRTSEDWNDLLRMPGLIFEGKNWRNDPVSTRATLLQLLAAVPLGQWWSLASFVAAVKERAPDFQRPAGDFDSWYIRDATTKRYLRGFENWERVDGALVRWIILGPLHWLGLVDVSLNKAEWEQDAFRITPHGAAFLGSQRTPPAADKAASARIRIGANGIVRVPVSANPYIRFRVARITKWMTLEEDEYLYRLTPASLRRADKQGVALGRITDFLRSVADEPGLPPSLLGAMQRWARNGAEAMVKETAVLKLINAELLETLQRTPKIKDLLGQTLGPTTVEVRRDDADRLRNLLTELGILAD
ncbi:MAG: helicase-associated domain-containing protein [Anaerolineales bacterium]